MTRWGEPLWHATAEPWAPHPALSADMEVDLAVVGGGFTGLSTALHAAQAGLSVAVLEAETVAWGASGRNAGFIVPNFARADPAAILARLGLEHGRRLIDFAGGSADLLFRLVRKHGIECDARQAGWIQAAHAPVALDRVRARVAGWREAGRPVAELSRDEVVALTGFRHAVGGWIDRSGGTIQPVRYAHGLARAAVGAGARLHERTPAVGLRREGAGWVIATDRARLRAARVVLATNAYAGALMPGLDRAYLPLTVHQIATVPLPVGMRARLLSGGQGMSDTRRNLFTFRFDAENRLITGGMHLVPWGAERRVARAILRRAGRMLGLPELPELAFTWSGQAALMPDMLPRLIELAEGLIAPIGCNGRGVAMTTALGPVLAAWAGGTPTEELPVPAGPLREVPGHWLARYAPNMLLPVSRLQDALEG